MKDFIEGLQKLLPFLAGLPFAPKIVISFIILLAAAFILLLMWSPTQTKEDRNTTSAAISTLSVKNIVDSINKAAPFQKDDIEKNYHGLKVRWKGELWNIEKDSLLSIAGSVRVELRPEHGQLYGIYFDVPIEKYPQLKIAQRGDLIGVSGRIIRCSGAGVNVTLEVDNVTFNEKP
jgi:hypothetical protein